jgi:RNA polymerase sigma-70 factor (ECF subfamily)
MTEFESDSAETCRLLAQIRGGDTAAFDQLFSMHRAALRRFVVLRLDPRVQARLDPSDVVQETQIEAYRRMDDFMRRRPMPFATWLRKTAYDRLLKLRRFHVETARRSVVRETGLPDRSSLLLAGRLLDPRSSPSQHLARSDTACRVRQAVAQLSETDREVLLMRNVEELPYREIGCILDLDAQVVRQRYGRALLRLRKLLLEAGLLEGQS